MIEDDKRRHHDELSGKYRKALSMAIEALKAQDRPKGKWLTGCPEDGDYPEAEVNDNGDPLESAWCSVCGDWLAGSDEMPTRGRFCPNCGADMREE